MTEQEKDFKTVLTESIGMVAVDGSSSPIAMIDLMDAHLSDRDQFAIGFAEWLKQDVYQTTGSENGVNVYVNIWDSKTEEFTISELLDLYKQSLTKTEKK